MTKEKRENIILLIYEIIFLLTYWISKQLWFPLVIFLVLSVTTNWIFNKYKPLKKGNQMPWWKELVVLSLNIFISMGIDNINAGSSFVSKETLISLLIFVVVYSLGSYFRSKKRKSK